MSGLHPRKGSLGPFGSTSKHACLWCESQAVVLPPKAFAVLHYLVPHPDRLVSKEALLDAVWPETAVSDAGVRVAIGALRKILGVPGHCRGASAIRGQFYSLHSA